MLETLVLLVLVVLPVREMWVYARWRGAEAKRRVVIVGGGFGGLYTALSLDRALGYHKDLEIVLLDKKNYFLFPPLLPSVATGAIESRQVTYPFRRIFEATNIVFKKECVERIDVDSRVVTTRVSVGPDPVPFVGHSKGGAVLMRLATTWPHRVTRLVNMDGLPFQRVPDVAEHERTRMLADEMRGWLDHRRRTAGHVRRPDTIEGPSRMPWPSSPTRTAGVGSSTRRSGSGASVPGGPNGPSVPCRP
ncbi:MAG: hypothetical protein DYH08_17375 [Actinobacteria bacterium ATB1]|nr:hypothetical protein [Actinobacteria bacterium ATB1]